MRFKNPGGELAWLMPLMAIGGLYVGYTSWQEGARILAAIFGVIGLLSALVWFDQKWVAAPLIGFCVIAFVLGLFTLYLQGVSVRRVIKLLALCYTTYELWEWRHGPGDGMEVEDDEDDDEEAMAAEPDRGDYLISPVPKNVYASIDDADSRR